MGAAYCEKGLVLYQVAGPSACSLDPKTAISRSIIIDRVLYTLAISIDGVGCNKI